MKVRKTSGEGLWTENRNASHLVCAQTSVLEPKSGKEESAGYSGLHGIPQT